MNLVNNRTNAPPIPRPHANLESSHHPTHTVPTSPSTFPLPTRATAFLPPSSSTSTIPLTESSTGDTNGSVGYFPSSPQKVLVTQGRTSTMATNPGENLSRPHPHRPPLSGSHSNSVPSTPSQQPRDLRFPSRSPSPHRSLTNHSPQSTVSEAVGKAAPVTTDIKVCKFETGAEIRKRRIPYVEGGNEELGPPKKELKKTLEPHEDEKLSGDMRELYDRLLPSDESEERRAKLVKKLERLLNEQWPGSDIRVNVFGSSGNLLSSSDSDVDICITTPLKRLETMHFIAQLLSDNGMEKVVCRSSAKVPIVKYWDPELEMACDLNVNNPLALENTRMIKTYVQLDPRVRPLTKIIKYWTKRRILNDAAYGGTISSYTWICMIISFLQRRDPPILPSLQKTSGKRDCGAKEKESIFADDQEALKGHGDANKESLGELLFQFFRHYGYEFDYSTNVVSIKEGRLLSRKEKGWQPDNYLDKEARCRLCVEEPFTTNRNLGNSADDYAWSGIHGELRRAFELLADGCQLEKACEQFEFPPEEKPIFQRPAPKPAPTLRRSASQTGGRQGQEQGSGRSRKSNRNNSSQRNGNRRASSGASFGNQSASMPFHTSPIGPTYNDYFASLKGNLHDQLFQQYQFLQAQQDALRQQLQAQQAQQAAQGRVGDLAASSPHLRAYTNAMGSPRFFDNPPQTAPLSGLLYQFPSRVPQGAPMTQVRSREGSSTNPSSPSLAPAAPSASSLRRQSQRGTLPGDSPGSMRSQSQPGRTLPHQLMFQQPPLPQGYDIASMLAAQQQQQARVMQAYAQSTQNGQMPFSPLGPRQPTGQSLDSAMPKEYMGYYVGQSPQLGPQPQMQYANNGGPLPPMTLRDPPSQRQRRVTPDLAPPVQNGRHTSRSPSPLGHTREYSIKSDTSAAVPPQPPLSPSSQDRSVSLSVASASPDTNSGGPLIVNGSTPSKRQVSIDAQSLNQTLPGPLLNGLHSELSRVPLAAQSILPFQSEDEKPRERQDLAERRTSPTRAKLGRLSLANSQNGIPQTPQKGPNGVASTSLEHQYNEMNPLSAAPLLSPVAELRTPSPTQVHTFDKHESPLANGFSRMGSRGNENIVPSSPLGPKKSTHERKGSIPNALGETSSNIGAGIPKQQTSPPFTSGPMPMLGNAPPNPNSAVTSGHPAAATGNAIQNSNPWQQATRKGHKKSKSAAVASASGGQALPVHERKGG